jgi:hypothetical protein
VSITSGRLTSGDRVLRQQILGPDEPPAVPNALDDEFNDRSFDTSKWTWLDQGPFTAYELAEGLYVQSIENSNRIRGIYQSAPSGSWTIRGKFYASTQSQGMGIFAAESTTGGVRYVGLWGSEFRPLAYSTPSSTGGAWGSILRHMNVCYAELDWDSGSSELVANMSYDGVNWVSGATATLGYTPALVGIGFSNRAAGYRRSLAAWFRRVA